VLFFICFSLYDVANDHYKLMVIVFSDPVLCSVSSSTDSDCFKFQI
jgi:hypothetical protein